MRFIALVLLPVVFSLSSPQPMPWPPSFNATLDLCCEPAQAPGWRDHQAFWYDWPNRRQASSHTDFYGAGAGMSYTGPYAADGSQLMFFKPQPQRGGAAGGAGPGPWPPGPWPPGPRRCCVWNRQVGPPRPDFMNVSSTRYVGREVIVDPTSGAAQTPVVADVWQQPGYSSANFYWTRAAPDGAGAALQFGGRLLVDPNRPDAPLAQGGFFALRSALRAGPQSESQLRPPADCVPEAAACDISAAPAAAPAAAAAEPSRSSRAAARANGGGSGGGGDGGGGGGGGGGTPAVKMVHKHTYATSDPLAAATFVSEQLGASPPGNNHHTCGASRSVTFAGTSADPGSQLQMHFVFNPHKPPGPVYMNATDLGLYEEHLRAKSLRNNTFDQFMDNHIGLVVESLDPFVARWRANDVPFVCRTWCCAEGMPQFPDRCPAYSFNRTSSCEVGCYVEVPHGIIMELQCGLNSYTEALACLTLVQPDTFDLCSSTR